jgi:simple sugar transport system permease protein
VHSVRQLVADFGWPRIIIFIFLVLLFVAAPVVRVRIDASLGDVLNRFGQNGLFVLAMVPMIQSGCGLNFGLSIGIIAGLLGATLSMQLGWTGFLGFFGAMALAMPFAVVFMCIMWIMLPYTSPTMIWGYAGKGLRTTFTVEGFWLRILNDFLAVRIGQFFVFPTGLLAFVALMCSLLWVFMKSKTGTAMTAVGSNPDYARAAGISIDRMRTISVIISTMLGAAGILVYEQSFGFVQLYTAPLSVPLSAVAAILIGGASVNKANLVNVVVGAFLFQGLLTMTPSVINSALQTDMSEVLRIIISNGMILYALTRKLKAAT